MSYTKIAAIFADAADLDGKEVTVGGWVRTIRDMKGFGFIELNDGSCFKNLQIVMDSAVLDNYKDIAAQNVGAALIVTGAIKLTPEAKQPLELKAAHIAVEGTSTPDYPLQKKRHSVEFLRTIQHLRPRTNLFSAAFRVRSVAAHAIHCFFQDQGFVYVHTPIITGSDCEGAGEMFQVTTLDMNNPPRLEDGSIDYSQDFFGKPTSLTVSGQLNCENFAMAFGNVYTFGPTFRAENSNTQRHAAEFWMVEPEMAFADLNDYMDTAEAMIKYIIRYVMARCPDEINFFNSFVDKGTRPSWYSDRTLYGGTIPWVGIHAIDWIYNFTAKRFLSVNSISFGKDPEMAALCQFEMEGGVVASVNVDYYRPTGASTHGDDRVRCVGTNGVVEVRDGKIILINADGTSVITPTEAPELLESFIDGKDAISAEEIFYLTKVAIIARDSADLKKAIKIED